MDPLQALVLGIVQGLTEFLPVSSSGHLVLANYYLFGGHQLPLWVDLASNTGTFLAALILLRREIWLALSGFFTGLVSAPARQKPGWELALWVLVASLPAGIFGFLIAPYFEGFNRPVPAAVGLILTGLIIFFVPRGGYRETPRALGLGTALLAGLAQAAAIFPGVSRSGSTISAMLYLGADSNLAARLSFLMYSAASFGVLLLALSDLDVILSQVEVLPLVLMTLGAFVSGYLAMLAVYGILRRGNFRWFAPYVWALAAVTLVLQLR